MKRDDILSFYLSRAQTEYERRVDLAKKIKDDSEMMLDWIYDNELYGQEELSISGRIINYNGENCLITNAVNFPNITIMPVYGNVDIGFGAGNQVEITPDMIKT